MTEHPNVSRHRAGHDAFRSGDVEHLASLFADDTVWHWPGNGPFGGDLHGRDSLSHMKMTRDGESWEIDLCEVVRWRDGRVAEEWLLVDDVYAFDEIWS